MYQQQKQRNRLRLSFKKNLTVNQNYETNMPTITFQNEDDAFISSIPKDACKTAVKMAKGEYYYIYYY